MPRAKRKFRNGFSYHVTMRCNNREFLLHKRRNREVLLFCIKRAQERFGFRLYGLCIMSNHVHYLIEPLQPDDMPRLMHWLNWYSAMCFNRLLGRHGHFWERRYHAVAVPNHDRRHVLTTLRYIHGNPKAAQLRKGFRDPFSNYGSYESGCDDGVTDWHLQFLALGDNLDACSRRYAAFCSRYRPGPKHHIRPEWNTGLLWQETGDGLQNLEQLSRDLFTTGSPLHGNQAQNGSRRCQVSNRRACSSSVPIADFSSTPYKEHGFILLGWSMLLHLAVGC